MAVYIELHLLTLFLRVKFDIFGHKTFQTMFKNLLNHLTNSAGSSLTGGVNSALNGAVNSAVNNAVNSAVNAAKSENRTYTFTSLPQNLNELKALPQATLTDEFAVAALSVLALTKFETDREECYRMLDFLKGPGGPMNPTEQRYISDRFMDGKFYKVNALFEGATPENNYTPATPYKIQVSSNPYSYPASDRATLYLHSGGADSPRPVTLRKKPSTGQWFIVQIDYLGDIRIPAAQDVWR